MRLGNLKKVWKTETGPSQGDNGLEVPNLHSLKFYNITITAIDFQKLYFKNEGYLTLKNESLNSLYSIMKVGIFRVYKTSESRRTP